MDSLDAKIKDSARWHAAQQTLDDFDAMMRLVRQYPTKRLPPPPRSPPYEPADRLIPY